MYEKIGLGTSAPLRLVTYANGVPQFDANGGPILNFTGPARTFIDDPSIFSRWRAQLGLRYFFQ